MTNWLNKELSGLKPWGKAGYVLGLISLIAALGWWLLSLYQIFSSFFKYDGLQLIFLPILKFLANPFLLLSLILFKLTKRLTSLPEARQADRE